MTKPANWVTNATILWEHRRLLVRITGIALLVSLGIAFAIPKRYKAVTSIMPPEQQGSGATLLTALAGRTGGVSGLAGSLFSAHSTVALYENLLQSGTVADHLIDRFHLQQVYRNRYRVDTARHLARATSITDDKKSGVITIEVLDTDPVRARDMAQAYLDELNKLVNQTSTSAARQERIFIERRLQSVQTDLETAQLQLSEFSSRNSTIDLTDQTRAMVDSAARIQAQILVEQSGLEGLRQVYGDGNVKVRESTARIASLQHQLNEMSGSSAPLAADSGVNGSEESNGDRNSISPPLRQLPRLAVPYADLYRRVKVQEGVYELLTQQYEVARMEEAKDVPVVSVIDPPGVPEKKSYPPRLLLTLLLTACTFLIAAAILLMRYHWAKVADDDPRKVLAHQALFSLRQSPMKYLLPNRSEP
jgi:capsule polysaccharide export protein KpsE/RkpR